MQKVYSCLTFETSTTYSLVLGVKLDLRPGEILALRWERMHHHDIIIDAAVKERTPENSVIGVTKTGRSRCLPTTPFLWRP